MIQTQTKSEYELFHEWLNNCPTKVLNYDNSLDNIELIIESPIEEEE